jgi:hypothetical protein
MLGASDSQMRITRRPLLESLESRAVCTTLPLVEVIYFSPESAGAVTGTNGVRVSYDDSDILRTTLERNEAGELISVRHELLFDGSDSTATAKTATPCRSCPTARW